MERGILSSVDGKENKRTQPEGHFCQYDASQYFLSSRIAEGERVGEIELARMQRHATCSETSVSLFTYFEKPQNWCSENNDANEHPEHRAGRQR